MAVGGFPPAVLAVCEVFVEAVTLAGVMSVSWLLLVVVRRTEGRGLLLMRTGPLVVLCVVEVSEWVDFWLGATSERL